jgi:hypothetical protein
MSESSPCAEEQVDRLPAGLLDLLVLELRPALVPVLAFEEALKVVQRASTASEASTAR